MGKRPAKYALLLSVISMLLGISLFVGSTFAWLTESETSGISKITSGSLEIQLWMNADGTGYENISDVPAPIFGSDSIAYSNGTEALWEPGSMQVAYLAVHNSGSLALQYVANLEVENISGDLYTAMQYAIIPDAKYGDTVAWTSGRDVALGSQAICSPITLASEETYYFALALRLDDDASNTLQSGVMSLDLKLAATQIPAETDKYGNVYYFGENESKQEGMMESESSENESLPDADDPRPPLPEGISVTQENIASIDYAQDDVIYILEGAFTSDLELNVAHGLTHTYDASHATFADGVTVKVNAPGVAESYEALSEERDGKVTVKGFQVERLNILAYANEAVIIADNTVSALSVIGGNAAFEINGNTVNGKFEKYLDGEGTNNDFGISLRITDYELSIIGNTITDTYSHAIGINGRQGEGAAEWESSGTNNQILSFTQNNITVNSTKKSQRAALKIWCDQTYAPYASGGTEPNEMAIALMQTITADETNVFTLENGHTRFNIFDCKK